MQATAFAQKPKLPKPEPVELTTADGVILSTTYYAPTKAGRETPIVVLLHMYEKDRRSWVSVAEELQANDIAALTVDLRGHGDSTEQMGRNRKLDPKAFRLNDFRAMVIGDMVAVKRELVRRHNAGQLNIERLGVVGAEMGASVAVLWAWWDWTNNQDPNRSDFTTIDGGKRGRDVKALALLSPQYNFKGLRITPLNQKLMADELMVDILAGSESRVARDARRLWKAIAVDAQDDRHTLGMYDTSLQGTELLSDELGPPAAKELIAKFMKRALQDELRGGEIAWKQRRTPFGLQPE